MGVMASMALICEQHGRIRVKVARPMNKAVVRLSKAGGFAHPI